MTKGNSLPAASAVFWSAAISAVYFYVALTRGGHDPLWMDEVLAVTAARQPGFSGVWHAIWVGTDFSPPLFHFLLHCLPASPIAERVVSILALYGAACCVAALAHAERPGALCLVAFVATLASPLFFFAIQVREYAALAFLLALSLLAWSRLTDGAPRPGRLAGLWLILALSISLHFYGVLSVLVVAVCEILRTWDRREMRWRVWGMLLALAPVALAWVPLARHLSLLNAADQQGMAYYARPTWPRLAGAVAVLLFGTPAAALSWAGLAIGAGIFRLSGRRKPSSSPGGGPPARRPRIPNAGIVCLALFALPLGAFILARWGTGAFSLRYASGLALLPGLMFALLPPDLPHERILVRVLLPVLCVSLFFLVRTPSFLGAELTLLHEARLPLPVVVADGRNYIEIVEAASEPVRSRLVFLATPPGEASPDPTNENALRRLASLAPRFQVAAVDRFVAGHPCFYLLRPLAAAPLPLAGALSRQGLVGPEIARAGRAELRIAGTGGASCPGEGPP